ncbi:MAG TPA: uracil-DNA glycosylase family protein [Sphingomonadales bacterium]
MEDLEQILDEIRACSRCADLPLGPRPVLRASRTARIAVCAQAPGTRVHNTGLPFNDPSGDRLRDWMGIDRDLFYDNARINIIPMGFCYPGRDPRGGDRPPRPECSATWHPRLFAALPQPELLLAIGRYAQDYHLGPRAKPTLTETVKAWRDYWPRVIPLPHPSPRNYGWLKRNPWFEEEVVPALRAAVARVLAQA